MSKIEVKPYNQANKSKKEEVAEMFDNISARYDFLNHFLSLGIDKIWRRKAIKQLRSIQPKKIIDIAIENGADKREKNFRIFKFAIEKSQILIDAMQSDIIVVGADFYEQTLFDKEFDYSLIPDKVQEVCMNWFLKSACIREVLPRIYLELALVSCHKFMQRRVQ
jgi:hypothetical protein